MRHLEIHIPHFRTKGNDCKSPMYIFGLFKKNIMEIQHEPRAHGREEIMPDEQSRVIHNKLTGQLIRVIESNDQCLKMEALYPPHSPKPVHHYHPYQTEIFTVLRGELFVKLDDANYILKDGDQLIIPACVKHSMWNASEHETTVHWEVRRAMKTVEFFEVVANTLDVKGNRRNSKPSLWKTLAIALTFENEFRMARPPFIFQKIIFTILKPLSIIKRRTK